MYKVIYTSQFYVDIWYIKNHITYVLNNPNSGQAIFNEIMDRTEALCDFPERYSKLLINNLEYRRMPIKNFNVYYCVDKISQTVTIARVLYSGIDINQVAIIN